MDAFNMFGTRCGRDIILACNVFSVAPVEQLVQLSLSGKDPGFGSTLAGRDELGQPIRFIGHQVSHLCSFKTDQG